MQYCSRVTRYAKNSTEGPSTAKKSKIAESDSSSSDSSGGDKEEYVTEDRSYPLEDHSDHRPDEYSFGNDLVLSASNQDKSTRLRYMRVAGKAAQVPFLSALDPHKFIVNAPINVYPVKRGGGGVRATGGDLTKESTSSVGGLIEYLCSGVGTFDLFGRETGAKIKRGYLARQDFLSHLIL